MNENLPKITDLFVLVSDVHIRTSDDPAGRRFLRFLDAIDPTGVRILVLNGDIFDFCFGASPYFRRKFAAIGARLSRLADCGVQVIFTQGNHEFALSSLGWRGVQFSEAFDLALSLPGETTIAITHGDRLCAPWHYHLYAKLVHSRLFTILVRLIPGAWLDRLALALSHQSRSYDTHRTLDKERIARHALLWLERRGSHFGIFGHFHVPINAEKAGVGQILCVDSWEKPNVLVFDGQGFKRGYFKDDGLSFADL